MKQATKTSSPSASNGKKPIIGRHLFRVTLLALPLTCRSFMPCRPSAPPVPRSRASFLQQTHDSTTTQSPQKHSRRWRRAFRKVLKRQQKPRKDSVFTVSQKEDKSALQGRTALQMSSVLDQVETVNMMDQILEDFDLYTPSDVFPNMTFDEISLPYVGPLDDFLKEDIDAATAETDSVDDDDFLLEDELELDELVAQETTLQPSMMKPHHRAAVVHRMTKSYFESLLRGLFHRWSVKPARSLTIDVQPKRFVMTQLVRGKLKANAKVAFRDFVTAPIQLSSGSVEAKRLTLNLWSFTPDYMRQGIRRYPSQFDFHFNDLVFSEDDLIKSRSIRNGLQRLLTRILKGAGVSSNQVKVTSIRILVSSMTGSCEYPVSMTLRLTSLFPSLQPSGKIACSGEAGTSFSGLIPFEVRSGIDLSSRGHVVTFPGLEVSLQPSLGVFMPVFTEVDLDMGHNARLLSVDINGFMKTLSFSGKVTVTPEHTLKLSEYLQTTESLGAQYNFDVGQWLTKLGNFTR